MKIQDIRETLISRTISVVAEEGLDKTTTKAIVSGTGINEVYIYRNFSNKDDLLSKMFDMLEDELIDVCMKHIPIMYMRELDYETRLRLYFTTVWRFLLQNRQKCLAYIRYYYSPYFKRFSYETHKARFAPLNEKFSDAFKAESVEIVIHHVFNVSLDFAEKVHQDFLPDNDDTTASVFNLIFASIRQFLKNSRRVTLENE